MPLGYQKRIENLSQSSTNTLFQYFVIEEKKTDILLISPLAKNFFTEGE